MQPSELNGEVISYKIHWQTEGNLTGIKQTGEQTVIDYQRDEDNKYNAYLQKLTPNETYNVWVRARSQTNEISNDSTTVKINVFPEPDNITLLNSTSYSLILQWKLSTFIEQYILQYTLLTSANDWLDVSNETTETDDKDVLTINLENLKPKTQYKFRLVLKYPNWESKYVWPKDLRFTFETLGDRPSPPGMPAIHPINDVYQVRWEPSRDNGAPIDVYYLEGLKYPYYRNKRSTTGNRTAWSHLAPSVEEPDYDWEALYNGTGKIFLLFFFLIY